MLAGCVLVVAGVGALTLDAPPPDAPLPAATTTGLEVAVTDARQLECGPEGSLWEIEADVVGRGLPGEVLVEVAEFGVTYLDGDDARATTVTPVDTGGFETGASTLRDGTLRAHPVLRTIISCGASSARLTVMARVEGDDRVRRADDAFLAAGVAMSGTTLGAIGLGLLAAASAFMLTGRGRRRPMAP